MLQIVQDENHNNLLLKMLLYVPEEPHNKFRLELDMNLDFFVDFLQVFFLVVKTADLHLFSLRI